MEKIVRIENGKRTFLPLLLLGDESVLMIDRYLDRGELYVLHTGGTAAALCVVTDEGEGRLEVKNIAVKPAFQRQGYGRKLLSFIERTYSGKFKTLQAGTGDSPLTVPFYEKCGFTPSYRIRNFFTEHYDHPIIEDGHQLKDMVYFKKDLL